MLPQCKSDFQDSMFWDNFFTQRNDSFEWYIDSNQLGQYVSEKAKIDDPILHIGTGNSMLPVLLHDSFGFTSQIALDFSKTVIDIMRSKHAVDSHLEFIEGDVLCLNETLNGSYFQWVLDKGLFDAMIQDISDIDTARVLFTEVFNVLHPGGTVIMVSLLQHHILEILFTLSQERNMTVRILQVIPEQIDSTLLPFIIEISRHESVSFLEIEGQNVLTFESACARVQLYQTQFRQTVFESKQRLLVCLELLPLDVDVNLNDVFNSLESACIGGVLWNIQPHSIVPIAYGLSKLVLFGLVDLSFDTDQLPAMLEESFPEHISRAEIVSVTNASVS